MTSNVGTYVGSRKSVHPMVSSGGLVAGAEPPFVSAIRRSRVNQYHAAAFAEYEVTCKLRVAGARVHRETVHKWSVWRRYSEFEELERALRKQLGWQMERVGDFAAKNTFAFNKLGAEFVEARREELDAWWQRLMRVDKVCGFHEAGGGRG